MAQMTTGNVFADVVNAAVRTQFDFTKDDIFNEIEGLGLFSEQFPDVPAAQISGIAGAGYGTLTLEGQEYGSNELWREYPKAITLRKWSSKLQWTEEDEHWISKANAQKAQFELDAIASNGIRPLIGNINKDIARMFYLGNGTTFFTGGDAVALISASHPIRKTGAVQTNIITSNPVLSTDGVDTAVKQMNRFKGMNDVQMQKVRRLRLVVPSELTSTAYQIRDSLYGPSNANLGLQKSSKSALATQGIDFDVVTLPEIPAAYAAYWWLVDLDRAARRFSLQWGWKPRMAEDKEVNNGTRSIASSTLFGPHATGWQFIAQSTGAGS